VSSSLACEPIPASSHGMARRMPGTEVKEVEKCGLCGVDPFKKDNFKDAVLRLIPHVTARNIKRN
jgi:hypothetical protein